MNRAAGTGLIGGGIALIVVGAILDFAVTVTTKGFNINTVGLILLIAGIVSFLTGIIVVAFGGRSHTTLREDVHATPGGHERVQERDEWASS
jgi:hypothetical protein